MEPKTKASIAAGTIELAAGQVSGGLSFLRWLEERGAQILFPTNIYEVVRYRFNGQLSILYRTKHGRLSYTGEAKEHFNRAIAGRHARLRGLDYAIALKTLRARDGDLCFYDGQLMDFVSRDLPNSATIEHLVPRSREGSNDLGNLVLAKFIHNNAVGDMDLIDKIKYRDSLR